MIADTRQIPTPVCDPPELDKGETPTSDPAYKQAVVPGGIPIVPRRLLKLFHLA
jgi:hypothetical protein